MAGFPSRNRAAFDAHWAKNILGYPTAVIQTILFAGEVAGNIGSWQQDAVRLVGYWIGREYWGRGVATQALASMLNVVTERPIHAHVAKTTSPRSVFSKNAGSGSSTKRARNSCSSWVQTFISHESAPRRGCRAHPPL